MTLHYPIGGPNPQCGCGYAPLLLGTQDERQDQVHRHIEDELWEQEELRKIWEAA